MHVTQQQSVLFPETGSALTLYQILIKQNTTLAGRRFYHTIPERAFQIELICYSLVVVDIFHDKDIHPLASSTGLALEGDTENAKNLGKNSG